MSNTADCSPCAGQIWRVSPMKLCIEREGGREREEEQKRREENASFVQWYIDSVGLSFAFSRSFDSFISLQLAIGVA